MEPDNNVVIEIFGEGKTDVRPGTQPARPTQGVVSILVHSLCGKPHGMRVKSSGVPFLQQRGTGKGLWQKVRFAKRQARYNGSAGAVFVVDSEGDQGKLRQKRGELEKGRDDELPDFPMAIGVAQPCIESWLLADAAAIRRAMDLPATPEVPDRPEDLPAPCQDATHNPKTVLGRLAGVSRKGLSADQKDRIALAVNDLGLVRTRCRLGFGPFADEVERRIRPLF